MGRPSVPYWHEGDGCYRSVAGGRCRSLRGVRRGDLAGAKRRLAEILLEEDRAAEAAAAPTVDQLAVAYLRWQEGPGKLARKTLQGHAAELRRFCRFAHEGVAYGARPAAAITATDLGRLGEAMARDGYAPTSVAFAYKTILACWRWANRPIPFREPEVILEVNPLASMPRPGTTSRADRDATREELAAFLRRAWRDVNGGWPVATRGRCMACMAAGRDGPCRRDHAATTAMYRDTVLMIRLIAETGARPGEACGATWDGWTPRAHRDAAGGWWGLLEVQHKSRRHTEGKRRKLLVPPRIAAGINRIGARPGRHETAIFAHRRHRATVGSTASGGTPWNTTALDRRVRQWREGVAGLRPGFTPYCLRHAYFSDVAPTIGAERAALVGGNSAEIVRRVYLRSRTGELGRAAEAGRAARRPARDATPRSS